MRKLILSCMLCGAGMMVSAQEAPKSRIIEDGGTGPYKVVMTEVAGLAEHTVFTPQDLSAFSAEKPLPVLVWGNGACANSPWEHMNFLNEIASNGFLVLATGIIPMVDEYYRGPMSRTEQQIESIDWAFAQNADPQSPYYQKIDLKNICVAGMSCGGLQTLFNCADKRIKALMICNSGLFNQQNAHQAVGGMPMPPKEKLKEIHTPIMYLLGGKEDIAYENGMDDFHRINHVPACAINFPVGHGGTYREPHGGEFTIAALAWLKWQLKGDAKAKKMFVGKDCGILKREGWTIEKNGLFENNDYETLQTEPIQNPMLWADVPDPDVIRVGDTFYLVSTTMHLMPGAPVMASKDLKNWETVSYIFDRLTDSPKYDLQEGTAYGRGQWATSLKYHKGKFYALLAPNERGSMGDTYIFSAEKAEGPWNLVSRMRHFHDCSLFFDDDDRVYVVYGTGELMELKQDLSDVIEGTYQKIFEREEDEKGLLEGSRMIKHNGKYYLLMISHTYAPGRHRREVCYRANDIHGPYEKQVILESEFGGFSYEAQGTIVDSPDGDWYGIIFQDRGGVGRVLTVMPCRWINGWPMLGDVNGKVPDSMLPYVSGQPKTTIVKSDKFSATKLGLHWQWNHNPIDEAWSLTERPGYLRLKTNRVVKTLYLAPNTLTQRMEGPTCTGAIVMDLSKMKDGDCAGLAAFNSDTGALIVKKQGKKLILEMNEQKVELSDRDKEVTKFEENPIESVALKQQKIWLRIDADFRPNGHGRGTDTANFFYSLDGEAWTQIGTKDYRLNFDWRRFFMGTKFGIFNYATKKKGGYVDIDEFNYKKP